MRRLQKTCMGRARAAALRFDGRGGCGGGEEGGSAEETRRGEQQQEQDLVLVEGDDSRLLQRDGAREGNVRLARLEACGQVDLPSN